MWLRARRPPGTRWRASRHLFLLHPGCYISIQDRHRLDWVFLSPVPSRNCASFRRWCAAPPPPVPLSLCPPSPPSPCVCVSQHHCFTYGDPQLCHCHQKTLYFIRSLGAASQRAHWAKSKKKIKIKWHSTLKHHCWTLRPPSSPPTPVFNKKLLNASDKVIGSTLCRLSVAQNVTSFPIDMTNTGNMPPSPWRPSTTSQMK